MRFAKLIAVVLSFPAYEAAAAETTRPNVLFLMSDDLRPELGCYGNQQVRTPNIDGLAAAGVRFSHAYVQFPLCNPSRTSLLTGRYPTTTQVLDNTRAFMVDHPDWISLPKWFQQQGYATLRCGKIFHGGIDDTEAWTEGGEKRQFTGNNRPGRTTKQSRENSDRIVILDEAGEAKHGDTRTRVAAIDYLERYRDRPFFIACGFTKPHSPPTAPRRFFEMYQEANIPLPTDFRSRAVAPPGFPELSITASGDLFIDRDATPEEAKQVKLAYHASLTWVDWNVGEVLKALGRLGLREKTIVLFWGDHGYHLGEKGKWAKHNSLFDTGTHVPLIVHAPRAAGNGQVCDRIVETVDLYPTLTDLCGLNSPRGLQGDSLKPLLDSPRAVWDKPAFSVTKVRNVVAKAVRTDRWRYAEWDEGRAGAMLIDEQANPTENANLVDDPKHADVVAALRKQLKSLEE